MRKRSKENTVKMSSSDSTEPTGANEDTKESYVEFTRRRAQASVLVLILVVLLILLCAVSYLVAGILNPKGSSDELTGTGSEDLTWVRSIYGWGDADGEQLQTPYKVGIGPDGTIWTTMTPSGFIVGLSPEGQLRHVLGLGEDGQTILGRCAGISVAENGEVYVADQSMNHIFVFSEDGTLLRSWQVDTPRDVEVVGDRVYVCAMGGVGIFNTDGELLSAVGSFGGGPEEFRGPLSVAVDPDTGDFYVCDTLNMRVKAYSAEGELLWIQPGFAQDVPLLEGGELNRFMTTDESGNAPFNLPASVLLDGNGRLLVLDGFLFDMALLDPANMGEVGKRYGAQGTSDGKFYYPNDFAYDASRDYIVVADTENSRLQVFRLSGTAPAGIRSAYTRLSTAAKWACCLPLILLLLLLLVLVLRRRARRAEDANAGASDTPNTLGLPGLDSDLGLSAGSASAERDD